MTERLVIKGAGILTYCTKRWLLNYFSVFILKSFLTSCQEATMVIEGEEVDKYKQ